jgi:putative FmdB family regulatory protein
MPTYEYRCPEGHDFERFYRKISDAAPQVACPECGKIAERIMSVGGGLLFKGSGFYLTDYGKNAHRGEGPPKADSGGDTAAPAAAAASDGGSSSKESGAANDSGKSSDAKPAPASAPAAEKKSVESKPAKSGGSKTSKDK